MLQSLHWPQLGRTLDTNSNHDYTKLRLCCTTPKVTRLTKNHKRQSQAVRCVGPFQYLNTCHRLLSPDDSNERGTAALNVACLSG